MSHPARDSVPNGVRSRKTVAVLIDHVDPQPGTKRANELTLAGLRPGRDTLPEALKRYKAKYLSANAKGTDPREWRDACTGRVLTLNVDEKSVIQEITV